MTERAVHLPPRAVAMPRRSSSAPRRWPTARPARQHRAQPLGKGLRARRVGRRALRARVAAVARGGRLVGLPSLTPRALAACSAALVRSEIMRRSACATSAMMPTTISLASGMSAATNLTPAFCRPSRKCASRLKPVDLGDHQRRAVDLAGLQRLVQRRAVVIVLAALDLDMLLDQLPVAAVEEVSTAARCASRPRPDSPCRLVLTRR